MELKDIFIKTDFDAGGVEITFTAPPGYSRAVWTILVQDQVVKKGTVDITPLQLVTISVVMPDFKPWSVNSPCQYTLKIQVIGKTGQSEITRHFGIRKIHIEGNKIYVNNRPFYTRGYIRGREAHDHPNLLNLPENQFHEKNILAAKRYGFNLVRFHSRVPSHSFLDAANRLGMFVQIELRNYKQQRDTGFLDDQGRMLDEDHWIETILSLRNHPSLMVYCMGCELEAQDRHSYSASIQKLINKYDPTRLFLDSCARGEFDRTTTDIEVQHMSYYYPFGRHANMFEDTYNWYTNGSINGSEITISGNNSAAYRLVRNLLTDKPVIAHEICHYVALRNIDLLERKFANLDYLKPWWLDELKKLRSDKGLEEDYPRMVAASRHFQFMSWKLGIEAARRSSLLCGFHFLQLSDTERYSNSNGIIDCFDDDKGVDHKKFLQFSGDSVLLADLPKRTFFEGQTLTIPVLLAHYSEKLSGYGSFSFTLQNHSDGRILCTDKLADIDLNTIGTREICQLQIDLPPTDHAVPLELMLKIHPQNNAGTIENSWNLWLYPNRPHEVDGFDCTIVTDELSLSGRYPQIRSTGTLENPQQLIITNRFTKEIIEHLEKGGDVLMLYRVPQTRDRKTPAPRERYCMPTTWERFKAVIWDRGTNCGGFIKKDSPLSGFPHNGMIDLQFASLIDDSDKMILDDFPVPIEPIIQGIDKAVRDRFDVHTFGLSEFQPKWTMRKFGYMVELNVGKGRLFITGFNFSGIKYDDPAACVMFESILRYIRSDAFKPQAAISPQLLERFLLEKGAKPVIKERKMTQFWQLDAEPVESVVYWSEAEKYIENEEFRHKIVSIDQKEMH